MPLRLIIAYALIVLMIAAVVGLVAWRRYHSRERVLRRDRLRHGG